MKRQNEQPLKETIHEMLDSFHLRERVNEFRLRQNWENIFGKTISRYTREVIVKNKKLFLTIESASLKQELSFNQPKMIERINEFIEPDFVTEIILKSA
jgi:predicted nucleic acid-binding Zn ribbon protein